LNIKFTNGSIIETYEDYKESTKGNSSKRLLTKIRQKCRHGHEFYPVMELNTKGELIYSEWSNNLCTGTLCDSVGWIDE
jgi:hypothetical protein